jgi:hypothetical protein
MSSRANVLLVLGIALAVSLFVALDLARGGGHEDAVAADREGPPDAPLTELPLVLFDGGYAVGPAYKVNDYIREQIRGTKTACQEPEPTPEDKAEWRRHGGSESATSFTALLRLDDYSLVEEVGSRLLDKKYGLGFSKMTPVEQTVFLARELDNEVELEDLEAYFTGTAGNCAQRALAAFDAMGATRAAGRLRRVIALFPDGGPSEDRSTRFDQLEALGVSRGRINHFGNEWKPSTTEIAAYIRANAASFHLPPAT